MFRIKGIYHSGRKGIRMEPLVGHKYEGLIGAFVDWNIEDVRYLFSTRFWTIQHHPAYVWDTSAVIGLNRKDGKTFVLETINLIYELEGWGYVGEWEPINPKGENI